MKVTSFILVCSVFLWASCSTGSNHSGNDSPVDEVSSEEVSVPERVYPELLTKALDAHGGIAKWQQYGSLEYQLTNTLGGSRTETQHIDLNNRKVLIRSEDYTIGMDGQNVWVSPDKSAFGEMSARFYHNLVFYFFSIPFVLADPGIQYQDLGEVTVDSVKYRALKISFETGVGDASDDLYIAHFNPETYQLELLLYTVTYFSGEKHENYNALKYTAWQRAGGLLVPEVMEGYKYDGDHIGELRYQAKFSDIKFTDSSPDQHIFEMPENAQIDSLVSQ